MYLNQCTIIGNLTRDPELRKMQNGTAVVSFGIATNENYKDKQGNKVESVEFHNCVAWGKAGEIIHQYMKKGSHIMVQGKLKTNSWDDKETGKKMYKTEINVRDFQFGRKNTTNTTKTKTTNSDNVEKFDKNDGVEVKDEINSEDIPF